MFKRLAKFRRLELRHLVPHWLEAAHSNDNPRGRRRPTGQRRSPQPVLACHWIVVDESRLECRRKAESFDETSVEEPGGRQVRYPHASSFSAKAIGHPRTGFRSSHTTLLHRNSRCDLSGVATTARGPGTVERGSSGVARLLAWTSKGPTWTKDLVVPPPTGLVPRREPLRGTTTLSFARP